MKNFLTIIIICAAFAGSALSTLAEVPKVKPTQVTVWKDTDLNNLDPTGGGAVTQKNPVIDKENARALLDLLLPVNQAVSGITRTASDVVVIHLVKWKAVAGKNEFGQYKQNWYTFDGDRVYSNSSGTTVKLQGTPPMLTFSKQEFEGTRIFGKKRFIVLTLYFGANMVYDNFKTWDLEYDLAVTPKIPTPFQHLIDFLGGAVVAVVGAPPKDGAWRAALFEKVHVPSDMTLNETVEPRDATGNPLQDQITASNSYNNEGRYFFDFSAGLPVKGVKELKYDASDNVVRAKQVTRENAYGFLNLFFTPQDASSDSVLRPPHIVLGVPISGKPLDRPVIGLGMGFAKKNFIQLDGYVGVVFNREIVPGTLKSGQAATQNQLESDLRSRRVRKLAIGINLPVGQFLKALKSK